MAYEANSFQKFNDNIVQSFAGCSSVGIGKLEDKNYSMCRRKDLVGIVWCIAAPFFGHVELRTFVYWEPFALVPVRKGNIPLNQIDDHVDCIGMHLISSMPHIVHVLLCLQKIASFNMPPEVPYSAECIVKICRTRYANDSSVNTPPPLLPPL